MFNANDLSAIMKATMELGTTVGEMDSEIKTIAHLLGVDTGTSGPLYSLKKIKGHLLNNHNNLQGGL